MNTHGQLTLVGNKIHSEGGGRHVLYRSYMWSLHSEHSMNREVLSGIAPMPGGPGLGQLLWARVSCPCPQMIRGGAKVTCGSRALVTADKGNGPLCVRSFAGVGAGPVVHRLTLTHAATGGTKMDIGEIDVFIGTGRRQGASTGPLP